METYISSNNAFIFHFSIEYALICRLETLFARSYKFDFYKSLLL